MVKISWEFSRSAAKNAMREAVIKSQLVILRNILVVILNVKVRVFVCCRIIRSLYTFQSCYRYIFVDFLTDDISQDVECAKKLFSLRGFQYWNGWNTYCRNPQNLPNLGVACNIY